MYLMDVSWCTIIIRPTVVSAHISSDSPRLCVCVCVYVLAKMVMVDGVDIRGRSVAVIKKLLQGPPDSPVQITLILKLRTVTIKRASASTPQFCDESTGICLCRPRLFLFLSISFYSLSVCD
jgi:hypothetical protein